MDDIRRITELLSSFPQAIYDATLKTEKLREAWMLTDARKDYEMAGAFLRAKADNLTEGQAKARATVAIYETSQAVVISESSYRRALADQLRLENEFTSIRKQANLLETTMQRMGAAA